MNGRCGRGGRTAAGRRPRLRAPGTRRALCALGAAIALVAACSGSSGDGGGGGAAAGDEGRAPARSGGSLPEPVCSLLDDLDEANRRLRGDTVFDLDAEALGELLAERREILDRLVERTEGELRLHLQDQVRFQSAVDESMLDGWEEERSRLAGSHDDGWMETVVSETVTSDDGETVETASVALTEGMVVDRLFVGCRAPELAGVPEQETSADPPPGRLVFVRPVNPGDNSLGDDLRLVVTDPSGRGERQLPAPEPWALTGIPAALPPGGPSGGHELLVGARQGDELATLVVSPDGEVVDVLHRAPRGLTCPAANEAGDQVLGLDDTSDADDRRLHLTQLTGDRPTVPLVTLPFATVGCGDFVGVHDRLVVGRAALALDDDRGVWTVGLDGSDPQELFTARSGDCTTDVGSVDPAGDRVAVVQACLDPLSDGLWVVDLATGEAEHLVTGHVARPTWSPDGEWLAFGFSPLGFPSNGTGIWLVRADGRQLREVVEPVGYTPVWLPPAG